MTDIDSHEVEKISVGAMLASARNDVDGLARLVGSLSREELIGCLAYCSRFVVAYARRSDASGNDFTDTLGRYAVVLAAGSPSTPADA